MNKLWRSNQQEGSTGPDSAGERANERTTLLPPRDHHHLDPDDPAVTPYNLLSVRSLRWISIILLIVSFVWWLVLLVSTFVSPPGLHTRGSGFFAFSYSTFATGSLLLLLLFYGTPSYTERVCWLIILFFLVVDAIMIAAAPGIRHEEGVAGMVSVLWALVICAWAVICDRVVDYGKREEEERLTGRRETRRSLREWCSVFTATFFLVIFAIITILFTAHLSVRARDATLSPPGDRYAIDNGKYYVHLYCRGQKTDKHGEKVTTVFLEGGEEPVEGGMVDWVQEAYEKGGIPRYCYWDRPGMAFSDNGPSPMSAGMAADVLSEALAKADEDGPWVLVSHGVGGIYSRIFASRHVTQVKGLLLIDTLPESLLQRMSSPTRGFLLWIRGFIEPLGLDRVFEAIFLFHGREDRVYGRDSYQNGKQIKAKLQENVAASFTHNEIVSARAILPRTTPVVIVSSGKRVKKSQDWDDGQRELSQITDKLLHWDVVNHAPHEVWLEPEGKSLLMKRLDELVRRV